jgi:hypothetical protein
MAFSPIPTRSIGQAPTLVSHAASYIEAPAYAPSMHTVVSPAATPAQSVAVVRSPPPLVAAARAPTMVSVAAAPAAASIAASAAAAPPLVPLAAGPAALTAAVAAGAPPPAAVLSQWADYSPNPVTLEMPALPEIRYDCYKVPAVPPGVVRFLKVDEPTTLKNFEQNFNDVKTAVRENNTHVQRNKTQVTNIARNHNHLLRIVTNENNYEHNLTNKVIKVADIHRQKIENVAGETRNFKDFKQTQKVENLGCRRADATIVSAPAPAAASVAATAVSKVATPAPPIVPVQAAAASLVSAPSLISAPAAASLASARPIYSAARAYAPSGYSYAPASAYAASLAAPASAYAASYASPSAYQVIAPEQRNPAVFI